MINGCYLLHLYCDYCDRNSRTGRTVPDVFTAETGGECRSAARRRGWRLDQKEGKAMCPACARAVAAKQP